MNKEIEELLNDLKSVYELNKPLTEKYKDDCMRFVINTKEAELLLSYIEQLENNRDKAIKILGNYKHYSTPTEEQNRENEEIVDNAYNILKGDSDNE